mmetsp:Transcript_31543/g.40551  ORF Transcript_31543/g.40551 Transcript_31543/m.40551 type:complete len:1182 (+) Transcript_31543:125-3670(+)
MSTIVPTYEGSKKDTRLRHGKGKYTYQYTGFSYDGDWNEGVKHGHGTMKLPDGSTFIGDFVEGEMTGKGKRIYPSGASYEGDFFRGEHHGKGVYTYPDGSVYDGSWCEKMRWGEGILKFANGDIFEGHFEYHHYHGLSKFTSKDGTIFEGDFEKGMRNGHGIEIGSDGSQYEGDWKEDKKSGLGVFEGIGEIIYDGEWGEGKALDASDHLVFENMNNTKKVIVNKGSELPHISVGCYYQNRDFIEPEEKEEEVVLPEVIEPPPSTKGGKQKGEGVSVPGTPIGGKLPTTGGKNALNSFKESVGLGGLGGGVGSLADVVLNAQKAPPKELKSIKESGRCLELTMKAVKLMKISHVASEETSGGSGKASKNSKADKAEKEKVADPIDTKEEDNIDATTSREPHKNIDLFVNRGSIADSSVGKLPCAIPALVSAANAIVPSPLTLDHLLGTVEYRHPGGAVAKYHFPPLQDLDRLDEDKKATSIRRAVADKVVNEANELLGQEAAEASMNASIAQAKAEGVEIDMDYAELQAEAASLKAVANALKRKGRFALAGRAVMTDVLKSRRLLPIGEIDSRFIEKKENELSAEMELAEEEEEEEGEGEGNTNGEGEDNFGDGGNEEGAEGAEGNTLSDEVSIESSIKPDSFGEAGGVVCKVLASGEACWTGGVVVDNKGLKFVDVVHSSFAAKTPAGRAATAGAISLSFDFWINPPTSAKDIQVNKSLSIVLLNSDIMTIKLVSDPHVPAEYEKAPVVNSRSRKRGSLAMARADKQAKQRIERSKFVRAKIVVTLVGVGDVETVVLDIPNLKTRLPPPPAPNAKEAAKLAAQACISYRDPPNTAALLPAVGGSFFGSWHSIALVINPKGQSDFYNQNDDNQSVGTSVTSHHSHLNPNYQHNDNNNRFDDLEHRSANAFYLNVFLDGDQLKSVPSPSNMTPNNNNGTAVQSNMTMPSTTEGIQKKNEVDGTNVSSGTVDITSDNAPLTSEFGVAIREDFPWCLTTSGGLKRSPCSFTFFDEGGAPYGSAISSFVIYDDVLGTNIASRLSGCYAVWRALEIVAQKESSSIVEGMLDLWRKEHPPKDPAVVRAEYEEKKERAIKRLEEKKKLEEAKAAKQSKKKDNGKASDAKKDKEKGGTRNDEKEKEKERKLAEKAEARANGEEEEEDDDDEDVLLLLLFCMCLKTPPRC